MPHEDLRDRLNRKIAISKKTENLPIAYDLLRLLIIRQEDWEGVRSIHEMFAIITSVAAENGLVPVEGENDLWDLPPRVDPPSSFNPPPGVSHEEPTTPINYVSPKRGEGKPNQRLHKTNGKGLPIPGQDRSPDDEGPVWKMNRDEW